MRPSIVASSRPLVRPTALCFVLGTFVVACQTTPPEPQPIKTDPTPPPAAAAATAKLAVTTETTPKPANEGAPSETVPANTTTTSADPGTVVSTKGADPIDGKWSLADATKDLKGSGGLVATITTGKGVMTCKLYDDKAPKTVANFVGLARGLRPWKSPKGEWVKKAAYDGTLFHRVIKGFMIQGGDPKGDGSGEPGYVIADEIWKDAKHDRAGLLCMANRGPNTNGQQFFITDASAPHLDRGYTIFGECAPESVVHAIADVPTHGDRPDMPVAIKSIVISREKK
ncbi:MAG: peptidylprolyl isomerase [Polyangiaceae bacterium]